MLQLLILCLKCDAATMHLQSLKPINTICCLLKSLDLQSNCVVAHMKDGFMKYRWSVRADCRFKWKTSPKPEVNGSGQNCVRCYLVKSQDCIHTCSRIITPLKWGFDNCKHFWMIIMQFQHERFWEADVEGQEYHVPIPLWSGRFLLLNSECKWVCLLHICIRISRFHFPIVCWHTFVLLSCSVYS